MSKTKKCVGKEGFLRMNYLYQLSNQALKNEQMLASNFYSSLVIGISKKTVQRIEPEIKRTICKGCHQLLIPGITCTVRIRKKVMKHTCTQCQLQKSYHTIKDYKLWVQKPEAVVETLEYTQHLKKSKN